MLRPSEDHRAASTKLVPLVVLLALILVALSRRGHDRVPVEPDSLETSSSQSPFEEVAQRTEEGRHGVPTGVSLNPKDEHSLSVYEQVGLGVALLLAIGLASRNLTPGLGAVLMKRFNPWAATATTPKVAEEQAVVEFAAQLQITERKCRVGSRP